MTLHVRDFASAPHPLAQFEVDCVETDKPRPWGRLRVLVSRLREARRRRRMKILEKQASLAIRLNGGVLTDELERRIARIMMGL